MNLIEGLLAALEAEHEHILDANKAGCIGSRWEAEKRAAAIVTRLTQLQPTIEDKK